MDSQREDPAWEGINQLIDEGRCFEAAQELVELVGKPGIKLDVSLGEFKGLLFLGFVANPPEGFVQDAQAYLKERR